MPLRAEGTCPACGGPLGVQVADGLATMASTAIENMMDRDGNKIMCANCEEYKDPDDVELKE